MATFTKQEVVVLGGPEGKSLQMIRGTLTADAENVFLPALFGLSRLVGVVGVYKSSSPMGPRPAGISYASGGPNGALVISEGTETDAYLEEDVAGTYKVTVIGA